MKKEYHGRYHDTINACDMHALGRVVLERFIQFERVVSDIIHKVALPRDGRDIVLRLRQEHVEPRCCSKLAPEMNDTPDHQVITEIDVTWEDVE